MNKTNSFYDIVYQIIMDGVHKEILHLHNEDEYLQGNSIILSGREVINFGSCSYLGLEFDQRLKEAAKQAIDRYGTQFSESRAYVSLGLYEELESLFRDIFGAFCVVTPTTSLGHIANIPVLINDGDAVIMDQQVHNSVQTAVSLLKASGRVYIELLRHNRMDLIEDKVKLLRSKHSKIWYLADGIYSMYGDGCPIDNVYELMNKYSELHFYVDDAHGMSIYGKHGRGFTLDKRTMHPKMVMATSLAKAFATGGAVMVYPNPELARKIRTCEGPLITSGPMQPSALGAAVASAKIHLSNEIYEMQQELHDKIRYTGLQLKKYGLPVVSQSNASVFFIGVSLPKLGYNLVKRMLNRGYYLNLGIFPAVPMKNTGIRFTITRLHTFSQIESMINAMANEFPKALKEEGMTLEQIYKAFKMPALEESMLDKAVKSVINQSLSLQLYHYQSIEEVDMVEWDGLFEGKGTFDWEGLKTLELTFNGNELPEDNWAFDYILIKDNFGKVIIATFLTTSLWKDDMLSPTGISAQVEERRLEDPYYLTSKVISTGSLLTEGEHLYIDKISPLWRDALQLLFEQVSLLQEKNEASHIVLRDFQDIDEELDALMVDNGFYRISMPDTHIADISSWNNKQEFYGKLSKRSRQHFREDVRKHEHKFDEEIANTATEEKVDYWYRLYLNVKHHSLELNTFTLSNEVFFKLLENKHWEVLVLTLKKEYLVHVNNHPVCMVFSYKTNNTYAPMLIGLDYRYNKEYKVYRQALYQLIIRAKVLDKQKVYLGFSATAEKKKVGAMPIKVYAYMQNKDSYNLEVLARMNANSKGFES